MGFGHVYIACAAGVVLSVIIPILAKAVRQQFDVGGPADVSGIGLFWRAVWQSSRRYIVLGSFSLAVALLIVALVGDTLKTWQTALVAGYLWDSTLQKIVGRP
jgi:hypothetical protein